MNEERSQNGEHSYAYCCIAGCHHYGVRADSNGRIYCTTHWNEEFPKGEECTACEVPKCNVSGCEGAGLVIQGGTGNRYCVDHAWKAERMEHGLRHPPSFTDADMVFLDSLKIKLDGDKR